MALAAKNYAFISYSHKDVKFARWLQHRLEQYVIPHKLLDKIHPSNLPANGARNLCPIFLDESDLTTGVLKETLKANLETAKYLIVLCSPHAAKSSWVSEEVQFFIDSGRLDYIIPVVLDGVPFVDLQIAAGKNPDGEECMPQSLVAFTKKHPDMELLGIDVRDNGMEKSAMRIISRMLGVNFDILWDRQARRKRLRRATYLTGFLALLFVTGYFFMPMRLTYHVYYPDDGNTLVMPDDGIITIEGTKFLLGSRLDTVIRLKNRPGNYRGRKLPVVFHATFFDTIRTEFDLGYGFSKDDVLYLRRDNTFALFAGKVIDAEGNPIREAKVSIQQTSVRTDEEGNFKIVLAPEEQAETQAIVIERAGYYDVYRPDECPSDQLTYIMYELE